MRINKRLIDTIVARAIKASFEKREGAQVKEAALAIKADNSLFSADLRKKVGAVLRKESPTTKTLTKTPR
jgi:hypothetical protein